MECGKVYSDNEGGVVGTLHTLGLRWGVGFVEF